MNNGFYPKHGEPSRNGEPSHQLDSENLAQVITAVKEYLERGETFSVSKFLLHNGLVEEGDSYNAYYFKGIDVQTESISIQGSFIRKGSGTDVAVIKVGATIVFQEDRIHIVQPGSKRGEIEHIDLARS